MSDSSQGQIRIYKETAWGETPSTSNKMKNLNITSDSLVGTTATKRSGVIRADGNTNKIGRTNVGASGNVGVELIYGEFDQLFEGCMRNTFSTALAMAAVTTISFNATGNKILDSGSGFTNVQVGQWLKIVGGVNDGKVVKVATKVGNGELDVVGSTLITAIAGPAITLKSAVLKNGVESMSFLIEKQLMPSVFDYFTGMKVGTANFTFALDDFITGSFEFMGKRAFRATATQGDGSPTAASALDSMNSIDDLKVYIDGALTTLDVTSFNFTMTPALREKKALGNLGNIDIGSGTFNITGNIEIHVEDNSLLTDLDNFTTKSFAIAVADAAGNTMVFDFPAAKLTTGARNIGGQDQDVLTSCAFDCQLDTTTAAMVSITRIPV